MLPYGDELKRNNFKALRGVFAGIARVFKASGSDVTFKCANPDIILPEVKTRPWYKKPSAEEIARSKYLKQAFEDQKRIAWLPLTGNEAVDHKRSLLHAKIFKEATEQSRPLLEVAKEYGVKPLTVEQANEAEKKASPLYKKQQYRRLYKSAVAKLPLHKRIARLVLPHSLRPKVSFKQGSVTHLNR